MWKVTSIKVNKDQWKEFKKICIDKEIKLHVGFDEVLRTYLGLPITKLQKCDA